MSQKLVLSVAMLMALSTCYGAGFFLVKISLDGFSNMAAGAGRIIVAALVLMFIMALSPHRFRLPKASRLPVTLNGLVFICFPFLSLPWILNHIPTSMVAIYYSAVPIFVLALSRFVLGRPISTSKWVGFLIATAGIAYLAASQMGLSPLSLEQGGPSWFLLAPHGVCILGSLALASGVVHMSTIKDFRPVQYQGYSLIAACILAVPFLIYNAPTEFPGWIAIFGMVMAGLVTTGMGQVLRGFLVQREGPTFTARNGYITPIIANILGLTFLSETITIAHVVTYAAVAAGLFISAQKR